MANPQASLRTVYMEYISCLNAQSYDGIARFVSGDVVHNGRMLGLDGYTQLIKDGFSTYSWLHFNVGMLVVDDAEQTVGSRLILKGTDPTADNVPREHVFYRFRHGKISQVWSMLEGFDS